MYLFYRKMAGTKMALIQLVLILFVFDIIRKIYFKPKEINNEKDKDNLKTNNNNNNNININNQIEKKPNKESPIKEEHENEEENNNKERDNEENENNNNQKNNNKENFAEKEKKTKTEDKKSILIYYDKYLYEKNFDKLKDEIENKYTNIKVEGVEYPLPESKKFFLKFTYVTQIGLSLLLIFTKRLKQGLPVLSDNAIKTIEDYKWIIIIGNFVLHFWLNKYLKVTGAFEIMHNKKILYSKLEKHLLPKESDIKKIIKSLFIKHKHKEVFNNVDEDDF